MYHTEGFVNKETINASEHIIMLAVEAEGRPWYLWCVAKGSTKEKEILRQALSFWLQQTLLTKGCKNEAYAQRELNRLGGYLQNMEPSKVLTEEIELFMYYKGRFYRWDSNGFGENYSKEYGMREDVRGYRELSKGVYGYVSEDALWQQYSSSDCESSDIGLETIANEWERLLLEGCSYGNIEQGFFFIWEDVNAF